MYRTLLAMLLESSPTVVAMCSAGIALLVIGVLSSQKELAKARGLDKIVGLANLCLAIPLGVFGALHLFGPDLVKGIVPDFMPWRMFWVYFVGVALIAASLSFATGIWVRWSGMLFGIMMFLFVAMIHFPGALQRSNDRILWTIVFREMSFGGAGWILAGCAFEGWRGKTKATLLNVGRVLVTLAMIVFGVEHFLHATGVPGVPLKMEMPQWIPGRELIDYVTGAALLVAGGSILLNKKTRTVATCVGGWIVLLVLVIYAPILIMALADPDTGVKIVGINYFADTLLFAGAILSLAKSSPRSPA